MKNKVVKIMKKTMGTLLTLVVVVTGSIVCVKDVNAADTYKGIQYVEYTGTACNAYKGKSAPAFNGVHEDGYGYLFAGWFKDDQGVEPIKGADNVADGAKVYAKFVPAYLLSIKNQNLDGIDETSEKANVRVVSSVDSLNYQKVGFELSRDNGDGSFKTMNSQPAETVKAYSQFSVAGVADPYRASDVFGEGAEYFTTWKVTGVPNDYFETIICIRPYWVTMDGVTVYGLGKYAHVEDGYLHVEDSKTYRYVNVPVNLYNATKVAAGVLSVNYNTDLKFDKAEEGQVFQEMAWHDNGAGAVKCVGNVSDISKNTSSSHVYINLRFKQAVDNNFSTYLNGSFKFTVTGEDFSDIDEIQYTADTETRYDVWNVKY